MDKETKEFVEACEAVSKKATPGPWRIWDDEQWSGIVRLDNGMIISETAVPENAEFVAHAREDLPKALGIIRAQAEEIQRLRENEEERRRTETTVVWGMK